MKGSTLCPPLLAVCMPDADFTSFPDGTAQFGVDAGAVYLPCTPRLPENALLAFIEKHRLRYEAYAEHVAFYASQGASELAPPMVPFW